MLSIFFLFSCVDNNNLTMRVNDTRPNFDLVRSEAYLWRALDEVHQADINLPDHQITIPNSFELTEWIIFDPKRSVYKHKLPTYLPEKRYRAAPAGMTLTIDNQEVAYKYNIDRNMTNGWSIVGDSIYFSGDLGAKVVLNHPGSQTITDRLSPSKSGLKKDEFVKLEATLDDETRECLFLPAPASATFTIDLPPQSSLQFGYGVREPADLSEKSDGVRFSLWINEKEIWGATEKSNSFHDQKIDLSKYSGQITLSFKTENKSSINNDFALFSSPIIQSNLSDDPRRIIVIGIDTLRPDHLGINGYKRDTSPELDQLAQSSFVFNKSWAPAPRTKPSFKTAFTGLQPFEAINGTTFGEVLKGEGFVTLGLSGNVHLVPRFSFNEGFEYWFYENGAKADDQVDRAIKLLDTYKNTDTFMFLHIMDPHIFYEAPLKYRNMFVEKGPSDLKTRYSRWEIYSQMKAGEIDETDKKWIEARHDAEIRFVSSELGRFLTHVDTLPGRTMIIVHSDHGEEFWEHNGFEHNHTLYDEVVRSVFWIRPPGGWADGPHLIDDQVGLIDLAPTLYDIVGVPKYEWPDMDGRSLLPLLEPNQEKAGVQQELKERPLPIGHLMYDTERWAVVKDEMKYILVTMTGEEELYDLNDDPKEQKNLITKQEDQLPKWRQELSKATGWPVGSGLRIELGAIKKPFEITFPVPVQEVGILDPEAGLQRRANIEWGETPKMQPEEVAEISFTEQNIQVKPHKRGTLYVLFADETPKSMELKVDGVLEIIDITKPNNGKYFNIKPGTLIVPKTSIAEILSQAQDEDMEALRALGYVE